MQQERPGEGQLCLGEICVCVISERKGFLSPLHLREAGEKAGQVGLSSEHTAVSFRLLTLCTVSLQSAGNSICLVTRIVSLCPAAHGSRQVHTLTLKHTLHVALCLQVSLWPEPWLMESVMKKQ